MPITPIHPDAETVTSRPRILQLLEQAREEGFELLVALPGSDEVWRTSLSRIDADTGQLTFGQLTPATWQEQAFDQAASIHCMVPGCRLEFSLPLSPLEDGSVCYFESALPESLRYHQLRKQFRISLTTHDTRIAISDGNETLRGELLNISAGGCRARLFGYSSDVLEGALLPECRLWIADELDMSCEGEVRHSQASGKGQQEVSLAFRDMSPRDSRQLQKCMANLQRAGLKQGIVRSA